MLLSRTIPLAKIALWCVGTVAFIAYAFAITFFLRSTVTKMPIRHEVMLRAKAIIPAQPIAPERGMPVRLSIPSINVDAAVDSVGMTADGAMDIKKNQDLVAWYNLGPRPGNIGNAVIAGHYGWEDGKGSVFNDLHSLKVGDRVSVGDDKGELVSFIVRGSQSYDPAADATTIFRSYDNKAHLNLITCEGAWNAKRQTYSSRLVVFTDKE